MADEMNTIQAELSVSIGSGQPQGTNPPVLKDSHQSP